LTKISQKLNVKVAVSIAFVALLVSLVSSTFSYYAGLNERKTTNYQLAEQLGRSMEKTAAIAAYLGDRELGQEIVNGLLSNDLVEGVNLFGEPNMFITQGNIDGQGEQISLVLSHPFIQDNQIGTLNLFPNEQFIQQQAQKATKKEVFLMLLHSVIIAFFVSIFVHRRLTRPIQNLTESFATINPSEPSTMRMLKIKHGPQDEIGKLVQGINSLMHELHLTISNERELREKTQELERKFRLIFEQASAGICLLDENNMITTHNPAFEQHFTPVGEDKLPSLNFPVLLNDTEKMQKLLSEIRAEDKFDQITLDIECTIGTQTKWLHCLFAKLSDQRSAHRDDTGTIIEVILHDITERTQREFQTRFEADHDTLTHLMNRRAGEKKLHKALFECMKNGRHLVLMMIDLDKFKPVNDTYGHEAGDLVLVEIARRIKVHFEMSSDICIRWGGDEFVVARQLDEFDVTSIAELATQLLDSIQQPIHISEYERCRVGASIGIVAAPKDGRVLHELMVNADNTMYQVKDKGRGDVAFYDRKTKKS
jgi:diguanylate cyclase (GGDEF)-like protein/PAS domain S-box-containing protein